MGKCFANYAQASRYQSKIRFAQSPGYAGVFQQIHRISSDSRTLPKIARPSIWQSIIPRALRNGFEEASEPRKKRAANPATYFIWIYLLIGSQAMRILQVQSDFNVYMRRADIKIGKLREVVDALQRGEEINVEKALGTGDEVQEREWELALKEIEEEDRAWQVSKQKRREAMEKAREEGAREAKNDTASPVNNAVDEYIKVKEEAPSQKGRRPPTAGFY